MSFWNNASNNGQGQFSMEEDIKPIPENTEVLAHIEDAVWGDRPHPTDGDQYINIKWQILKPQDYKNRKIFQKLRVLHNNPEKAKKQISMLAAIDKNADAGLQEKDGVPDDADLSALQFKQMYIKLGHWQIDGKEGNWVKAVAPSKPTKNTDAEINESEIPF